MIDLLTRGDPEKAEAAIEDRAAWSCLMCTRDKGFVPVKHQIIGVAKKYLALEAQRLDNRLTANGDIGEFPRQAVMPVFAPQLTLENAIRHGMEEMAIGGVVDGRWWQENDQIHIRVNNPIPAVRARRSKSTPGQSLVKIRQRFQNHYSGQASLISVEEDSRLTVTVVLPNSRR